MSCNLIRWIAVIDRVTRVLQLELKLLADSGNCSASAALPQTFVFRGVVPPSRPEMRLPSQTLSLCRRLKSKYLEYGTLQLGHPRGTWKVSVPSHLVKLLKLQIISLQAHTAQNFYDDFTVSKQCVNHKIRLVTSGRLISILYNELE